MKRQVYTNNYSTFEAMRNLWYTQTLNTFCTVISILTILLIKNASVKLFAEKFLAFISGRNLLSCKIILPREELRKIYILLMNCSTNIHIILMNCSNNIYILLLNCSKCYLKVAYDSTLIKLSFWTLNISLI
jgi:hypothetical protein